MFLLAEVIVCLRKTVNGKRERKLLKKPAKWVGKKFANSSKKEKNTKKSKQLLQGTFS